MKRERFAKMMVKGIKKPNRETLFWDIEGDESGEGVLYYEDKVAGLLFRQILPQDVEIMQEVGEVAASQLLFMYKGNFVNGTKFKRKVTEEETLRVIRNINPSNGLFSLAVYDIRTADFICIIDVEPIKEDDSEEAKILVGIGKKMAKNKVMRRNYESLVKRRLNKLLIDSHMFPKGCQEKHWNGFRYETIPIE